MKDKLDNPIVIVVIFLMGIALGLHWVGLL
jgi:hypothetical protein